MPLPPNSTLEEVKLRIREAITNPSIGNITQVVLKDGPRAFRIATLLEIKNPQTGQFHHYSLKLDSIERKAKEGWFYQPERSIRIEGEDPNEIETLCTFLQAAVQGALSDKVGDLHLIRTADYAKLETLLTAIPNLAATDQIQLIRTILTQLDASSSAGADFVAAFAESPTGVLAHLSTAARYVQYRTAYTRMQELIDSTATSEPDLQEHLTANPWMFGSEYSELLPRRVWARDDTLDFMLRRTVDGYLEIIEIKRAFPEPLFIHDVSHDSYYPSSKLSPVIGQVIRYIENVERTRDQIVSRDRVDPLKIRARIIIGRDGNENQQAALRRLNCHLHGIEIITFDQLIRIAGRVLRVFESDSDAPVMPLDEGEVPF